MRLTTRLAVAALALAVALPAAAQSRIGIVDFNRALYGTAEGKAAHTRLTKELEDKKKAIETRQTELQKFAVEAEKQAVVMSDQAKREKQAEFEKRQAEFQKFYVGAQKELAESESKTMKPIADRVRDLVREVAQAEGVSVVLDPTAGVLFADDSLDMTNEIIRKYDARFPGGGAAAAKKPEPKADAKPAAPAKK